MQLRAQTISMVLCLTPGLALAQTDLRRAEVVLRSSVYVDDDATVTSASVVAGRVKIGQFVVGGHYLVDAISSASIDVVTAATSRFEEVRHEGAGTLVWADGTTTLNTGYIYSSENDWESHTVSIGAAHDLLDHNLTLNLGASGVANTVGRAGDSAYEEALDVLGLGAGAVVVLGTEDIVALRYSLSMSTGQHASPYRFAPYRSSGGQRLYTTETLPDRRLRHAATALWNHHLAGRSVLRTHVRLYLDSWAVRSVTVGTSLEVGLGPFAITGSVRGYAQHGASIYAEQYAERSRYMTFDRELSTFYDLFLGLHLSWTLVPDWGDRLRFDLGVQTFGFWFANFERLSKRLGLTANLGVEVLL